MRMAAALLVVAILTAVAAPGTVVIGTAGGSSSLINVDVCGGPSHLLSVDGDLLALHEAGFAVPSFNAWFVFQPQTLLMVSSAPASLFLPPPEILL